MEKPQDNNDTNSLEGQNSVTTTDNEGNQTSASPGSQPPKAPKKKRFSIIKFVSRINVYFLFFLLVVVIAGLIVFIGYQRDRDAEPEDRISTQELTAEELAELAGGDTVIGDPQQLLTIESNAVFSGQVLVRDDLDVAGTIRVGGDLSLPGITVSGTSNFDQIQANNLSIAGDTNIQGQLTLDAGLSVGGGGTFGGGLSAPLVTTDSLQLTGDLQISRHIDAGGPSPSVSSGGAIGSGGTVSVSGTDTAGTVTVNPGGGAGNGPVATVSFAQNFNGTPHVVVTPVGRYVDFYITRNTGGFTIHIVGGLSAGSLSFDFIAID